MEHQLKFLLNIITVLYIGSVFKLGVVNTYCWCPSNHTSFRWRNQKVIWTSFRITQRTDGVLQRRHLPHLFPQLPGSTCQGQRDDWGLKWGKKHCPLQEGWGAHGGESSSALSCHACSHQKVFIENLIQRNLQRASQMTWEAGDS